MTRDRARYLAVLVSVIVLILVWALVVAPAVLGPAR